jgi:serine/threonine protein kinase
MTSTLPSQLRREKTKDFVIGQCPNNACRHLNLAQAKVCDRCGSPLLLRERYRIIRSLGSGGFASIFEAVDEDRLSTPCVIKQFTPDLHNSKNINFLRGLFQQEAEILTKVGTHLQIPSLLAFFEEEGRLYIVQEFIDGWDLFSELSDRGAFNEAQIWQFLNNLLPVLQFIHEQGIVHRDIKLGNILRQQDGTFALIDFGSSQQLDTGIVSPNHPIIATLGYAAPEQMEGRVDPASDLYSLGVTAIRLLTASLPDSEASEPLFDEQKQQWRWRQTGVSVSEELAAILDRLVESDVRDRFQSAAEVLLLVRANLAKAKAESNFKINSSPLITVDRESNIDYQNLENLLTNKQYQQADRETWQLLMRLSDREEEGFLNLDAIAKINRQDLLLIDRLWREASDNRFGFTIQKQIYQQLGGTKHFNYQIWRDFGELVGWHRDKNWLNYASLNFTLSAPPGHLPACFSDVLNRAGVDRGVCGWWRLGFVFLMQKINSKLEN